MERVRCTIAVDRDIWLRGGVLRGIWRGGRSTLCTERELGQCQNGK